MSGGFAPTLTAAVLAGGLGTRLRSAVADRPKALAQINGRPFLAYLLDQLAESGLERVVLCTGYRAEQVQACFGDRYRTLELLYSVETEPLGTGGALRQAGPLLGSGPALVVNGDSYVDADLNEFYARHAQSGARGSVLLVPVEDVGRFGQVELAPDGRIVAFREKQPGGGPGLINAGVYLLERELRDRIPAHGAVSLERDCFPRWLGRSFLGQCTHGRFIDIGTPESYRQAEEFFAEASLTPTL